MNFGERLATERKRLGFKSADFAVACGVAAQSQSIYENGKRVPDADYLMRACTLGADPAYLLTGRTIAECAFNMSDDERGPLVAFAGLSPKVRRAMMALVDATRGE